MSKHIRRIIPRRFAFMRYNYRYWRESKRIRRSQPTTARAKVIIAALGPNRLKTRGKVNARAFFPAFCRALARHGIGSVYVKDLESLEQELLVSQTMPAIVVNLVHEVYDFRAYDVPDTLRGRITATFNSHCVASTIRDKENTNDFLSQHNIAVPSRQLAQGDKIFSNVRIGSHEPVFVYNNLNEMDVARYNVQFIDTRQEFGKCEYYTSIRLMCIGPRLLQILVRARDVRENDPSVHTVDTPVDRALLDYLYGELVEPRLDRYILLANTLGRALGPGFYAHDVLVDNRTFELSVCETGFKFFDNAYWSRIKSIVGRGEFQYNIMPEESYAERTGGVFVSYCEEMGFL